jgi:transcriptional regulator with XRE-family HTH domain
MDEVGREVRRLREERGWNQAKLAVEAGMAPSAVNQIENGKRSPSAASLTKLAEALEVGVADLFPKAGRRSSPEPPLFDGVLEDERRLQWLRTWEEFMQHAGMRWHARLKEHEERGLPIEPAWAEELAELHLELGLAVIHGLLPNWEESLAPERERNVMHAIARTLRYLGEVSNEAAHKVQTPENAERYKQRQAELQQTADEIQARLAG